MATAVSRTSTEATTILEQPTFPLTQKVASLDDASIAAIGIALMDNTTLGGDDTIDKIDTLIASSVSSLPHTAAICVYGKFVAHARSVIDSDPGKYKDLLIATVVNFPEGTNSLEDTVAEAKKWVVDGADEVDLVINYNSAITNENNWLKLITDMVVAVKAVCVSTVRKVSLKVIIESGALKSDELIGKVCGAVLTGGCDFVKTSTGKVPVNATLEAARVILERLFVHQKFYPSKILGFKAAGGVRNVTQTREYLQVAEDVHGVGWISPSTFRFGASSLLAELRSTLKIAEAQCVGTGYELVDEHLVYPGALNPPVCIKAGLAGDLVLLRWHIDSVARIGGRVAAQALSSPSEFGSLMWGTVLKLKDMRPAVIWTALKPHLRSIAINSLALASKTIESLQSNPRARPLLRKLKELSNRPAFDSIKQLVMSSVGGYIVSN